MGSGQALCGSKRKRRNENVDDVAPVDGPTAISDARRMCIGCPNWALYIERTASVCCIRTLSSEDLSKAIQWVDIGWPV